MNSTEFADWKQHPVTKQVFLQVRQRILDLQEELGLSAGISVYNDAARSGAIRAYNDLLNIEYEESQ